MPIYTAKITFSHGGKVDRETLIEWLKNAIITDIDTEEYGMPDGMDGCTVSIDWDSLNEKPTDTN